MTTTTEETTVIQKTRELCEAIVAQPEFQEMRRQIDQFMSDEQAKSQYETLMDKHDALQQKQQMGLPIPDAEIEEFNKHREVLVNNPVAKGFLDAQQAMHDVQKSIGQYVAKTFELGHTPTEEEMAGCCGGGGNGGCGCSH
jgi:cell fate (sporulation/competence/biofilm development) regulator YlbF (YheA/YmcA/DUF963 family)